MEAMKLSPACPSEIKSGPKEKGATNERQCIGGAHPQGALQTMIAEGVTKADVAAIIGDEVEHRRREIKNKKQVRKQKWWQIMSCLKRYRRMRIMQWER